MKVAIIGAGLAGLSCAIVLEKRGILPDVFEKTSFIGEREAHVGAILHIIDRPKRDMVSYIRELLGIEIKVLNTVNTLTHYSPNQKTSITGKYGYFTRRDQEESSLKGQLFSQLAKTKVTFNSEVNYKDLLKDYDFVVAADGKPDIAEELGCWTDWIRGYIKGAVLEGDFDPTELIMWLDHSYCRNGYAYLTPFGTRKASLALYVPYSDVDEIDANWDSFLRTASIQSPILETFKVYHTSGHVYPHRHGKMFLAGNTGGCIDPFLGFGQVHSILMGGFAARAIAEGADYEKLVRPIETLNRNLFEIRREFDKLSDKAYDRIVKAIGLPVIQPLIYNTSLNVVKYAALALRIKRRLLGEPD